MSLLKNLSRVDGKLSATAFVLVIAPALTLLSGCTPAPNQNKPMDAGMFWFNTLYFIVLMIFLFYFVVVRPAQRKDELQKKVVSSLKKNDDVAVHGGILGKVVSVADDAVTIEIAPNTRVRVLPSAVTPVSKPGAGAK